MNESQIATARGLAQDLSDLSDRLNNIIENVHGSEQGNIVDPAVLAAFHVDLQDAASAAASLAPEPQGSPVPDTGTAITEPGPSAGPAEVGNPDAGPAATEPLYEDREPTAL